MRRRSSLDHSFLRVGTAGAGKRVGTAMVEPPGGVSKLDPKMLAERIAERRHRAPRCRRLAASAPLGEPSSAGALARGFRGGPSSQRGSSNPAYS
jgi:hypothetical protein